MLIEIFLPVGLAIIMFSLGLGLSLDDFRQELKTPRTFFACFLSQILLLPIVTLAVIAAFKLEGMLAVGMMIIALARAASPPTC